MFHADVQNVIVTLLYVFNNKLKDNPIKRDRLIGFLHVKKGMGLYMNHDLKKILVEIVCVVVRNILNIWKRETLKKKKA